MNSEQTFWKGSGGDAYTLRSKKFKNYDYIDGTNRRDIIKRILNDIPRDSTVLELGCNSGNFIGFLKDMGFKDITGVEINRLAYETCRQKHPDCNIINSSIEDFIPKKQHDLVLTSGVLIHLNQTLISTIYKIRTTAKKWIFGNEYYSKKHIEIEWPSYCASMDYANMFSIKPKIDEVHETKDGELWSFYLIEN